VGVARFPCWALPCEHLGPRPRSEPVPVVNWLERFAAETLKLKPELQPLDAVRAALNAFSDASGLEPENARTHVCRRPRGGTGRTVKVRGGRQSLLMHRDLATSRPGGVARCWNALTEPSNCRFGRFHVSPPILRSQRFGEVLEVGVVYAGPLLVQLAGTLEGPFVGVHGEMQ
jgi:hypothetical protein